MNASDEAAAIFTRTFEALARQCGKTLSQKTRADLARACELLAAGDDLAELLDNLPEPEQPRITRNLTREEEQWQEFRRWQVEREEDAQVEQARRIMRR